MLRTAPLRRRAMPALKALALPAISDEERERRRAAVETAESDNLMEGIKRHPGAQAIYDDYIAGLIDVAETGRRVRALPMPD